MALSMQSQMRLAAPQRAALTSRILKGNAAPQLPGGMPRAASLWASSQHTVGGFSISQSRAPIRLQVASSRRLGPLAPSCWRSR
jgi:hypothetical protein